MIKMTSEKGARYVWPVIAILALIIVGWSLLFGIGGVDYATNYELEMSGSQFTTETLEEGVVAALKLATSWIFILDIWFGAFGLLCAWGLRRRERFAWKLGILWGTLAIAHAIIVATVQVFIAKWPTPCAETFMFGIIGAIALSCLFAVRKKFV
jgi:hypothetical protein